METTISTMPVTVEVDQLSPESMPETAQQALCLIACGFSQASVARLMKCSRSNVTQLINKYDANRTFALSATERRRFLAKLWEARAGEALLNITPDKMEAESASGLARIAAISTRMAKETAVEEKPVRDPQKLLASLGRN